MTFARLLVGLCAAIGALVVSALASVPHVSVRTTNCFGRTVKAAIGTVDLCADVRVQPEAHPNEDENQSEPVFHRYLLLSWDYAEPSPVSLFELDAAGEDDPFREPDAQDGAIGSALIQLNGVDERILHQRKMTGLSGGEYSVVATVYTDEQRKKVCSSARTTVTIR